MNILMYLYDCRLKVSSLLLIGFGVICMAKYTISTSIHAKRVAMIRGKTADEAVE